MDRTLGYEPGNLSSILSGSSHALVIQLEEIGGSNAKVTGSNPVKCSMQSMDGTA